MYHQLVKTKLALIPKTTKAPACLANSSCTSVPGLLNDTTIKLASSIIAASCYSYSVQEMGVSFAHKTPNSFSVSGTRLPMRGSN